jgi:hypothetical protein
MEGGRREERKKPVLFLGDGTNVRINFIDITINGSQHGL